MLIVSELRWVTGWPDLPLLRLRRVHSFCHLIMSCWMVLLAGEKPFFVLNFLLVTVTDLVRIIVEASWSLEYVLQWIKPQLCSRYSTDKYVWYHNKYSKHKLSNEMFQIPNSNSKKVMAWSNRLLFCGPPCILASMVYLFTVPHFVRSGWRIGFLNSLRIRMNYPTMIQRTKTHTDYRRHRQNHGVPAPSQQVLHQ